MYKIISGGFKLISEALYLFFFFRVLLIKDFLGSIPNQVWNVHHLQNNHPTFLVVWVVNNFLICFRILK